MESAVLDRLIACGKLPILRGLKIAINHTRFGIPGGIERYIEELVRRLLAAGHQVDCVVRRMGCPETRGLRLRRVPVLPLGEGIKVLSFAYASAREVLRGEQDIVHGFSKTFLQDVYTDGSGSYEDYLEFLQSASWTRRASTYRPLLSFANRHVERLRFRRHPPHRVLALSRMARDQILRRHDYPPEHIEVLHSGVDLQAYHPGLRELHREPTRKLHSTPEDATVLLFAGQDYRRKGLPVTLEALARGRRQGQVLWVAGTDRYWRHHEGKARALGVEARFLGPQPDLRPLLGAADIFVFPSRYDIFGNAALEALAAGLPSVISASAGVHELVRDGLDALILKDPEDPEELGHHLARLLDLDPKARQTLGLEARRAAEKHSWDRHFDRLLCVYDEVRIEKQELPLRQGRGSAV